MIYWLLFWLPPHPSGAIPPPTPVALPFLRRDGEDLGPLPVIVRRSS